MMSLRKIQTIACAVLLCLVLAQAASAGPEQEPVKYALSRIFSICPSARKRPGKAGVVFEGDLPRSFTLEPSPGASEGIREVGASTPVAVALPFAAPKPRCRAVGLAARSRALLLWE